MDVNSGLATRRLGSRGPVVGALGFGAMGLSGIYGPADDDTSRRVILQALESGITLIDTSDVYGDGHNEQLVGSAIAGHRDQVVLATKFGAQATGLGRPARVRAALDASLLRLRTDHVDIYYVHRLDQTTPVEDTVGALGQLVQAGKIGHIGLCEASPATVRRAHATFPITVVQQEYSLVSRDPEEALVPVLAELGIGLVAYSPLGRGLLTGRFRRPGDLPAGDNRRRIYPRFYEGNLPTNVELAGRLSRLAAQLHTSPAALALGWVLARPGGPVPIVGTRTSAHLAADIAAATTRLDATVLDRLDELFPPGIAAGDRYNAEMSRRLDR